MIRIYEVVTNMGCQDEYFMTHEDACDFARRELDTEIFEVVPRDVPESYFDFDPFFNSAAFEEV